VGAAGEACVGWDGVDGGSKSEGGMPLCITRCRSRERVAVSLLAAARSITVEMFRSACDSLWGQAQGQGSGKVKVKACNRTLDNAVLKDLLVARLWHSLLLAYLLQYGVYQGF
jgi:hypothetical protein